MEQAITEGYSKSHAVQKPLLVRSRPTISGLFHSDLEELEKVAERVTHWLAQIGLKLSPTKTRTTHTLTPYQGQVGFDFLGFTIHQFPGRENPHGKRDNRKGTGLPNPDHAKQRSDQATYPDHQRTTAQISISLARATDQRTQPRHLGMGSLLQDISGISDLLFSLYKRGSCAHCVVPGSSSA